MRIGVDLGGTKIAGVVLADDGRQAWTDRRPTPQNDYAATLDAIEAMVNAGEAAAGVECSVGVGTPGAISPASRLVKNANSTWLNGRPFQQDLEARLSRSIRVANDANCLAVSEAIDGNASGASIVFGVILGTGVGGGLVVDRRALTGVNAIAGEWGHNPLPWADVDEQPGPACYCGRHGCIETFLSGPGLAADYERHGGSPARAEEIVARAAGGEPLAVTAVEGWHGRLARALASVINVVDPEVIVVGGGLSNVESLYAAVPRAWGRWVFSDEVATRLVRPQFGDASGVRGAARLWG